LGICSSISFAATHSQVDCRVLIEVSRRTGTHLLMSLSTGAHLIKMNKCTTSSEGLLKRVEGNRRFEGLSIF
jgi:hypothetical protein